MGCDLHFYVEYTDKESVEMEKDGDLFNDEPYKAYWRDFGMKFNPGRNYWMFGLLSKGVRSNFDEGFEPKGIPNYDSLGFSSRNDYTLLISDNERDDEDGRCCTMQQAMRWSTSNFSPSKLYYRNPTDDKPYRVSNPDWHSASWLTLDEYERTIQIYKEKIRKLVEEDPEYNSIEDGILPEYEAILSAMKSLESNGYVTRVVFWFDN